MPFLRAAFLEESGAALIKKYAGLDPLFTPEGYAAYADDLLVRMVNPNLLDTVERVGRDPARKLAWDDRLIGTMRMAQAMGIRAERYALGSAAALAFMAGSLTPPGAESLPALLGDLWANAGGATEAHEAITGLIAAAAGQLARWAAAGFPDLEMFWRTLAP
jgi:mannitol-1-phosphate 5-dehydrogenase